MIGVTHTGSSPISRKCQIGNNLMSTITELNKYHNMCHLKARFLPSKNIQEC